MKQSFSGKSPNPWSKDEESIRLLLGKSYAAEALLSYILREEYVSFDDYKVEPKNDSSQHPYVRFLKQLAMIFVKIYSSMLKNLYKKLTPVLKGTILEGSSSHSPMSGAGSGGIFNKRASRRASISSAQQLAQLQQQLQEQQQQQQPTMHDVILLIVGVHTSLKHNLVPSGVVNQMMDQAMRFIDSTLLNDILLRSDMCSYQKGVQIKFNATLLEQSISSSLGRTMELKLIRQAATLLMMKKDTLVNRDVRLQTVPNLNSAQIGKMLLNYIREDYEAPISQDLLRFFSKPEPALLAYSPQDKPGLNGTELLIKAKQIAPFSSLQEIFNAELEEELLLLQFPVTVREKLDRMMLEQRMSKQQIHLSSSQSPGPPLSSQKIPSSPPQHASSTLVSSSSNSNLASLAVPTSPGTSGNISPGSAASPGTANRRASIRMAPRPQQFPANLQQEMQRIEQEKEKLRDVKRK